MFVGKCARYESLKYHGVVYIIGAVISVGDQRCSHTDIVTQTTHTYHRYKIIRMKTLTNLVARVD